MRFTFLLGIYIYLPTNIVYRSTILVDVELLKSRVILTYYFVYSRSSMMRSLIVHYT